jgi:hypothetical protein
MLNHKLDCGDVNMRLVKRLLFTLLPIYAAGCQGGSVATPQPPAFNGVPYILYYAGPVSAEKSPVEITVHVLNGDALRVRVLYADSSNRSTEFELQSGTFIVLGGSISKVEAVAQHRKRSLVSVDMAFLNNRSLDVKNVRSDVHVD